MRFSDRPYKSKAYILTEIESDEKPEDFDNSGHPEVTDKMKNILQDSEGDADDEIDANFFLINY